MAPLSGSKGGNMKHLIFCLLIVGCGGGEINISSKTPTSQNNFSKNFSWANANGENYLTSIKKQTGNNCYVYASTALYEIQFNIEHGADNDLDLSEQNLHNCLKVPEYQGGNAYHILKHIHDVGVLEESFVPTGQWGTCDNCKVSLSGVQAKDLAYFKFRNLSVVFVENMPYAERKQALVKALQNGPVLITIASWHGFKEVNGKYKCQERNKSGHSVVVVGYENNGDTFLIKNSHGDKGLLRFSFDGGNECGFATTAIQVNGTYVGKHGAAYCFSDKDTDKDGIPDIQDNCPYKANEDQGNFDGDAYGDVCDPCWWFPGHNKSGCF